MSNQFSSLGLSESIVESLAASGITDPFPIQAEAIPAGMTGRDIQGKAPTGSGKTLAFGLPVLSRVGRADRNQPRALVLAPTRELAEQIRKDLAPLANAVGRTVAAIYGGVGYGPQLKALRSGVDVLVATPGRLEDLIERRSVNLGAASIVVLDEADRMADMGFLPAVRRILDLTNATRQTYLFSATLDGDVATLGREYQTNPVSIEAGTVGDLDVDVIHHFWRVAKPDRPQHTARLIDRAGRSIVFTRTRHGADRLVKQLAREDIAAVSLHGGRSQNQRTRALRAFSTGRSRALVATDVAARGIHISDVDAVIHYDLAGDHKDYLHRSGRTGRAGDTGTVISMVVDGQDRAAIQIQRRLGLNARIESPDLSRLDRSPSQAQPVRSSDETVSHTTPRGSSGRLFVGNLPWKTTSDELETLFSDHGRVQDATISKRGRDGRPKGYGFVDMAATDHQKAIDALNGTEFGGRVLRVRLAR